jgi:hypothetical protein
MIGIGLIIGSYYNWDWFMKMWGHLNTTEILGRGCARIFYTIGGVIFVIVGVLMMIGIIKP